MATCEQLGQRMRALRARIAALEKSGEHSEELQELLDELSDTERAYEQQGCDSTPPPPSWGHVTTTVLDPTLSVPQGWVGTLNIQVQATSKSRVTEVEYQIEPEQADVGMLGRWSVTIPQGDSTQQATLMIAVSEQAAVGQHTIPIVENVFFGSIGDPAHQQYGYITPDPVITVFEDPDFAQAKQAIAAKTLSLGPAFTGPAVWPGVERLDGGAWNAPYKAYGQRFTSCTIYYSAAAGAHEIHGPLRDKYDQLNGCALLGVPVNDMVLCPDQNGMFVHFDKGGSIYIHPKTGPFAVYGMIRDFWAQHGWERGPFGYPTRDQYEPRPGETACVFQNDTLWSDGTRVTNLVANQPQAGLSPDRLLLGIWTQFDKMLHQADNDLGLHPDRSIDAVSENAYDFTQTRNRIITVTIKGFHSNPVVPDTEFQIHLSLLFHAARFRYGGSGYEIDVDLTDLDVDAQGPGSETVKQKLTEGIKKAFPIHFDGKDAAGGPTPIIPADHAYLFLGLLVHQDGGFSIHFSDVPIEGGFARFMAQQALDKWVAGEA